MSARPRAPGEASAGCGSILLLLLGIIVFSVLFVGGLWVLNQMIFDFIGKAMS